MDRKFRAPFAAPIVQEAFQGLIPAPRATAAPLVSGQTDTDQRSAVREVEIPFASPESPALTLDVEGVGAAVFVDVAERVEAGRNRRGPGGGARYEAAIHLIFRLYAYARGVRTLIGQGRILRRAGDENDPPVTVSRLVIAAAIPAERYEVTIEAPNGPQTPAGIRGTLRIGARVAQAGAVAPEALRGILSGNLRVTVGGPITGGTFYSVDESPLFLHEFSFLDRTGALPRNAQLALFGDSGAPGQPAFFRGVLEGPPTVDRAPNDPVQVPNPRAFRVVFDEPIFCPEGLRFVANPDGVYTPEGISAEGAEFLFVYR